MSLYQVTSVLQQHPALSSVSFHGLTLFLRMSCVARPLIEFQHKDKSSPPAYLDQGLLMLLGRCISVPNLEIVQICWVAFKDIIWSHPDVVPTENEITQYNEAALSRGTCNSQ
jgi:hypothetical protein